MLAYGKGYVQLEGKTLRVIPHVQNLETCARHCDMDSQCTHWRRCAGVRALPAFSSASLSRDRPSIFHRVPSSLRDTTGRMPRALLHQGACWAEVLSWCGHHLCRRAALPHRG